MAENKELNDAWNNWEKMDDTGYGREGSNKPKATQRVQEAYRKQYQGEYSVAEPLPVVQQPLMPMTGAEEREAARRAVEDRLQPNGRYRKPKRPRAHPSDFGYAMRDVNKQAMIRSRQEK